MDPVYSNPSEIKTGNITVPPSDQLTLRVNHFFERSLPTPYLPRPMLVEMVIVRKMTVDSGGYALAF